MDRKHKGVKGILYNLIRLLPSTRKVIVKSRNTFNGTLSNLNVTRKNKIFVCYKNSLWVV